MWIALSRRERISRYLVVIVFEGCLFQWLFYHMALLRGNRRCTIILVIIMHDAEGCTPRAYVEVKGVFWWVVGFGHQTGYGTYPPCQSIMLHKCTG